MSIGKTFFKETSSKSISQSTENKALPNLEMPYEGELMTLPSPSGFKGKGISLKQAIKKRKSHRNYRDEPLSKLELSYALWTMQGVRKKNDKYTLRNVPSAGARHAFETLILINNVVDLPRGLYRYVASKHAIVKLHTSNDIATKLESACLNQKMISQAAVSFFLVADSYRMTYRYHERGYRYLLLDAGHVIQNLYLVAEDMDAGTVAVGAYDDIALNDALGLDGEDVFVVYVAPLGKKEK